MRTLAFSRRDLGSHCRLLSRVIRSQFLPVGLLGLGKWSSAAVWTVLGPSTQELGRQGWVRGRGHLIPSCHICEAASGRSAPSWVSGLAYVRTQTWAFYSWGPKARPGASPRYTQGKGRPWEDGGTLEPGLLQGARNGPQKLSPVEMTTVTIANSYFALYWDLYMH